MAPRPRSGRLLILGIASGLACAGLLARGTGPVCRAGQEATKKDLYDKGRFSGAASCARCHTRAFRDPDDLVILTEYTTWRFHDKHSLAYAVLEGPRGQRILGLLRGTAGQWVDPTKELACLNCHALHFPDRLDNPADLKDGVSCETCHGPSEGWYRDHSLPNGKWRGLTAREKREHGMYDVRDPAARAELCFSCHLGDADKGKVVTHAMFAAGHPPLRSIEVADFSRNMPAHWRPVKDVPFLQKADKKLQDEYGYTTADSHQGQLVQATSMVGLNAALRLVAQRSEPNAKQSGRWPEFAGKELTTPAFNERWPELALAHSDCYGCHHELRVPSWRQRRGYPAAPGRPQLRPWPFALAELDVRPERSPSQQQLTQTLHRLAEVCGERPFGNPTSLATAARPLAPDSLGLADLKRARLDQIRLMKKLCTVPAGELPDFESARQIVAALTALQGSYAEPNGKAPQLPAFRKRLAEWAQELNVNSLAWARAERVRILARRLAEVSRAPELVKDDRWIPSLDAITNHSLDEAFPKDKDPDAKKMLDAFLDQVSRQRPETELSKAILNRPEGKKLSPLLEELQTISDKEFEEGAAKQDRYDPVRFVQSLSDLSGLLPKE